MKDENEILDKLSSMTLPQLYERCSVLLARKGAINSNTGKPLTTDEIAVMFAKKFAK